MLSLFTQPILITLIFFYHLVGNNLGFAIILLTLAIRVVLVPLTLPAMRSAEKMKNLKPELDKLKAKHGNDKTRLQQEQLKLYQQHNLNPLAGCLPYIVQFVVLIALYQVLVSSLQNGSLDGVTVNSQFGWLILNEPDRTYVLPIVAGLTQLLLALMIMPATDTTAEKKLAVTTKSKKDDKAAGDMTEMAQTMQQQMVFVMPALTFFIALRFPSGLALYWIITTVVSIVQQYYISGWGGLKLYSQRLRARLAR